MLYKNMVALLNGTVLGVVLLVPIFNLNGFGAIGSYNYVSFHFKIFQYIKNTRIIFNFEPVFNISE